MDQNIKKQWVEALRSGKYEQGKDWLQHQGKFCCLGVLCDLHAKATNNDWSQHVNVGYYLDQTEFLPEEVVDWAGLLSSDPCVGEKKVSWYNDAKDFNFDQIANLIESNL